MISLHDELTIDKMNEFCKTINVAFKMKNNKLIILHK